MLAACLLAIVIGRTAAVPEPCVQLPDMQSVVEALKQEHPGDDLVLAAAETISALAESATMRCNDINALREALVKMAEASEADQKAMQGLHAEAESWKKAYLAAVEKSHSPAGWFGGNLGVGAFLDADGEAGFGACLSYGIKLGR